ncbi:MAG: hypothetical protein IIA88_03175 [Bacteroidetes bacterium]|nr:hypothetical protein [Bacteroidota bacterium]
MIIDTIRLKETAEIEFSDIVENVILSRINVLKVIIKDKSFLNVWFSLKRKGIYSYHWERRFIDGSIYRHDNVSHKAWQDIKTFPKHFHNGSDTNVEESYLSDDPEEAVREFLNFIRGKIKF